MTIRQNNIASIFSLIQKLKANINSNNTVYFESTLCLQWHLKNTLLKAYMSTKGGEDRGGYPPPPETPHPPSPKNFGHLAG